MSKRRSVIYCQIQHLIGTLDVRADPFFTQICHISTALLSLRSRNGHRLTLNPPNFSHTFDPTLQDHNFSLHNLEIILEFICQHFQIGCCSTHQKVVAVLFQVEIISKPFVNTRMDVFLLEKHVCHELVA